MKTTFAIRFYCRKSKANKEGLSPIEMVIHLNSERINLNLPIKVSQKEFIKPNEELINYLSAQRLLVNKYIQQLTIEGITVNAYNLKQLICKGSINSKTLNDLFKEYLDKVISKKNICKCVYNKWLFDIDLFKKLFDMNRTISSFNKKDINILLEYLNDNYKESTIEGHINRIKAFFLYAIEMEYISNNPFIGIKIKKSEEVIEYLTQDELNQIRAYSSQIERLNKVRDIFLFLCGSGLAYCDMANLKKEDIKISNGIYYITKPRIKTKIQYTSVLLPFAIDILNKYDYQLPIISNQKLNAYLIEIGDICGISKKLHSHLGRKTYATLLLNNKVDIYTVAKSLGHTNIKQTMHYAKKLQESIVSEIGSIVDNFK